MSRIFKMYQHRFLIAPDAGLIKMKKVLPMGTSNSAATKKTSHRSTNGDALGFEASLWAAADKMREHMDASEYKSARPEGLCLPRQGISAAGAET